MCNSCNDINWHPEISISGDDEMSFMEQPVFEGCPYLAHQKLVPGDYSVTITTMYELDEKSFGDSYPAMIRVTVSDSDWICVNCGMTAVECESDESDCGHLITMGTVADQF